MIRAEGPLEGPVRRERLASAGLPRGAGTRARLGSGLAVALLGASAALLGVRLGRGGAGGLRAEQIAGDLLGAGRLLPRELAAAEVTVGGGGGVDRAEQPELFDERARAEVELLGHVVGQHLVVDL